MKVKDTNWMNDKIQDIKKRKRKLELLQDPEMKKRIKKDLKREYRSVKRGERNQNNIYMKKEIDEFYRK